MSPCDTLGSKTREDGKRGAVRLRGVKVISINPDLMHPYQARLVLENYPENGVKHAGKREMGVRDKE